MMGMIKRRIYVVMIIILLLSIPSAVAKKEKEENILDLGRIKVIAYALGFVNKELYLNNTEATWIAKNGAVNGTIELGYFMGLTHRQNFPRLIGCGIALFHNGEKIGKERLILFKNEVGMNKGKFRIPVSLKVDKKIIIIARIWAISFPPHPMAAIADIPDFGIINLLTLGIFGMKTVKIKIHVMENLQQSTWIHTRHDTCNTGYTPAVGKGSIYSYHMRVFTKHLIGMGSAEPKVVDIDNDGKVEIIFTTQTGHVYAVENGRKVDWKCDVKEDISIMAPELGEVDGDGKYEVIVSTSNILPSKNAGIKIVDDNGKLLAEWMDKDVVCPYGEARAYDINNDGKDEILVGSLGDEEIGNRFYVLSYENGEIKELWRYQMHFWVFCAPAVADLDGDGKVEIIVTSYDLCVYCFDAEGNLLWRYITKGGIQYAYSGAIKRELFYPVVADINKDGYKEIIVNTAIYDKKNWSAIYCLNYNGELIWKREFNQPVRDALAVADIDNDGFKDIIFGINNGTVGVLDRNGELLWQYKLPEEYFEGLGEAEFFPSVADLNGDGYKEIVVTAWHHGIFIFSHDGRLLKEWPYKKGNVGFLSPAIADIDGDGDLEIITAIAALFGWYGIFGKLIILDQ